MRKLNLEVTSEIVDGLEEVWVTTESIVIHLTIHAASGALRRFSCRLDADVVAEAGETRNALTNETYPMLHLFTEGSDCKVGSRYYIQKRNNEWIIEE